MLRKSIETQKTTDRLMGRRAFVACLGPWLGLGLAGCKEVGSHSEEIASQSLQLPELTPSSPNPESPFGVDAHINMETIDSFIGRSDTVYRDMRLIEDPAAYVEIGGSSNLDMMLEGFKIVPFPYIGTLAPLPVSGAYDGDRLFDIEWGENLEILSAKPRYSQSMQIVEELFPPDKPLMLMCGGGGYAGMMRAFLLFLGWDGALVYNVGGMWEYTGYRSIELISYDEEGNPQFCLWRADSALIDFSTFVPLANEAP